MYGCSFALIAGLSIIVFQKDSCAANVGHQEELFSISKLKDSNQTIRFFSETRHNTANFANIANFVLAVPLESNWSNEMWPWNVFHYICFA